MEWFKWFGGASNDPKFHVVAKKTNQPMGFVVAVWAMLLERASEAEDRGSIAGFDCEAADVVMGMPDGAACAIVEAMQAKGLIEGDRIYKWEERQGTEKPSRPTSTPRVQRFRERQRADAEKNETSGETDETQRNTDETHETWESVSSQFETVETSGETDETHETHKEERRGDKNIKTPSNNDLGLKQDARVAQTVPKGGGVEETSLEFLELREAYDQSGRKEAPLAGFEEYKALKKARQWPGLGQIFHALESLARMDSQWRAGKAPGLAKFLKEQWWRMEPRSRASPAAVSRSASLAERNMKTVRQVLGTEPGGDA